MLINAAQFSGHFWHIQNDNKNWQSSYNIISWYSSLLTDYQCSIVVRSGMVCGKKVDKSTHGCQDWSGKLFMCAFMSWNELLIAVLIIFSIQFTNYKTGRKRSDESQISSDCSGTGPSLAKAASSEAGSKKGVLNKLIHLTKRTPDNSYCFKLTDAKQISLTIAISEAEAVSTIYNRY